MGNPATIRAAPSTRAIGNSGGAKCQCVRYQGTYTASVPGAMTRKIAEPMIAAARCTIGSYSTPSRIVRCRPKSQKTPEKSNGGPAGHDVGTFRDGSGSAVAAVV